MGIFGEKQTQHIVWFLEEENVFWILFLRIEYHGTFVLSLFCTKQRRSGSRWKLVKLTHVSRFMVFVNMMSYIFHMNQVNNHHKNLNPKKMNQNSLMERGSMLLNIQPHTQIIKYVIFQTCNFILVIISHFAYLGLHTERRMWHSDDE